MNGKWDTCIYFNCYNYRSMGISFFKFPKDEERLKIWLENSGNAHCERDKIQKRVICQEHFHSKYISRGSVKSVLMKNAVPYHYREFSSNGEDTIGEIPPVTKSYSKFPKKIEEVLIKSEGIPPDAREEAPTIPLPEMKTYSRTHQMGESSSFQNFEEINESSSALSDDDNTNEEYSMSEACFDTPLETKVQELIEVSDTQVIAKPEIVTEPEYTANEKKVEFPTANECASFGEYIAKNLQQLPLAVALKLQSKIHELVMESRLEYVRQNPHAEAPVIVKEEFVPVTEDEPTNETITREIPPEPSETGKAKRQRETDPPDPSKRPKRNHPDSTMTDPANTQRIDVDVFAKHIKEQLVKLPEDISVKLQTDIYTMIMQAKTKNLTGDNGIQGRAVRIKTEIDEDQADFIDGYDLLSN